MKLADIADPLVPMAVATYANDHNYKVIDFRNQEDTTTPNLISMLNKCILAAKEKGCVEFCLKEIRSRYGFMEDTHTWHISVIGFIPKTDRPK